MLCLLECFNNISNIQLHLHSFLCTQLKGDWATSKHYFKNPIFYTTVSQHKKNKISWCAFINSKKIFWTTLVCMYLRMYVAISTCCRMWSDVKREGRETWLCCCCCYLCRVRSSASTFIWATGTTKAKLWHELFTVPASTGGWPSVSRQYNRAERQLWWCHFINRGWRVVNNNFGRKDQPSFCVKCGKTPHVNMLNCPANN